MKRIVIILAVCIGLWAAYWLISPLFITREVNEALPEVASEAEETMKESVPPVVPTEAMENAPTLRVNGETQKQMSTVLAEGTFSGLAGHNAEGAAKLIKIGDQNYIRFEDDFRVTNGPDLFVYLGKNGEYVASARLDALKGNVGSQNYTIPSSLNVADYNEVWVWCRAFSVPFGKAELREQ